MIHVESLSPRDEAERLVELLEVEDTWAEDQARLDRALEQEAVEWGGQY